MWSVQGQRVFAAVFGHPVANGQKIPLCGFTWFVDPIVTSAVSNERIIDEKQHTRIIKLLWPYDGGNHFLKGFLALTANFCPFATGCPIWVCGSGVCGLNVTPATIHPPDDDNVSLHR